MKATRRILLYGNSVILGSIGASLRRNPDFQVTTLILSLPRGSELQALNPDVVVFDLESARPESAFSLLATSPGLLLIGISPDKNVVKVWSGRQLRELSTQDLIAVIDGQFNTNSLTGLLGK